MLEGLKKFKKKSNLIQQSSSSKPIVSKPSYEDLFKKGRNLFGSGKYNEAFVAFNSAFLFSKKKPESLCAAAECQVKLDNIDHAKILLQRARKFIPENKRLSEVSLPVVDVPKESVYAVGI